MKQLLISVYLNLFLCLAVMAQQPIDSEANSVKKHLIYFTDKEGTPYTIQSPQQFLSPKSIARRQRQNIPVIQRDLPVNPAYVAGLKAAGAALWYTSRWFNAAIVEASPEVLEQINNLPYVKSERALNRTTQLNAARQLKQNVIEAIPAVSSFTNNTTQDYGRSFHQANMLGVKEMHDAGFRGETMTIAVLDAGFPGVNTIPAFAHLYQDNRLKGTFDFVEKKTNVYGASSHGTAVLSTIAAYEPGVVIGTAYKANFLLLRTEDAASEHNIEEINWLLGAEYADSAGADVINSSLGYSMFDEPSVSYTNEDMDGNTALVTKAADYAAAAGILVVTSAGNDGRNAWRYIAAPADGDSVLAVGAVDSLGVKASFSSFGPTSDQRIKPDVVAMGTNTYVLNPAGRLVKSNGTSFAGPIVAGFAAALWQANSSKTNMEMIELIRQSGTMARNPDNNIGYGIPNYNRTTFTIPEDQQVIVVNPVRDNKVTLLFGLQWLSQQVNVRVYDATGKLVWQEDLQAGQHKHTLALNTQKLKQGVYLCRLQSGSQNVNVRFVKL